MTEKQSVSIDNPPTALGLTDINIEGKISKYQMFIIDGSYSIETKNRDLDEVKPQCLNIEA